MHSNKLLALPPRFESLAFLRTLNLTKNALSNATLEVISQITTLVEVYLAHNDFEGPLTADIGALTELQILDLEGNRITSLPDTFGKLRRMRILLLGDNHLENLPWEAFEKFGDLYELDIFSNKLSGDLLPSTVEEITLSSLSTFDIHSNSLTSLPSNLILPSLTQFNATQNLMTTTRYLLRHNPTTRTFISCTKSIVHHSRRSYSSCIFKNIGYQ